MGKKKIKKAPPFFVLFKSNQADGLMCYGVSGYSVKSLLLGEKQSLQVQFIRNEQVKKINGEKVSEQDSGDKDKTKDDS